MAWVDNFIIVGKTEEEVNDLRREFLSRCKRAKLELQDTVMPASTSAEALGLEFDLVNLR